MRAEETKQRKAAELQALSRWAGEGSVENVQDVLEQKIRLMRRITAREVSQANIMLTNIQRRPIKVLGEDYHTDYTRQGSEFTCAHQLPLFYPGVAAELWQTPGKGYFLKSGQSANYLVLMILTSLGQDVSFDVPQRTIYFETDAILFYLQQRLYRPGAAFKGLLLDSGVASLAHVGAELLAQHDVVVFDTTCFASDDPELARLLGLLVASGKTTFLTRSHLKLDSLGVEYGALGSVFMLNQEALRYQLPSEIGDPHCRLDNFTRKIASLIGLHAQPHEIYPFLNDPEFLRLNGERVRALRTNMGRVESAITRALRHHGLSHLTVESYGHRLYCKVRLRSSLGGRLEQAFAKIKKACGVAAHNCDSFGFDFLGVCAFRNSSGQEFLRVTSFDDVTTDEELNVFFLMLFGVVAEAGA